MNEGISHVHVKSQIRVMLVGAALLQYDRGSCTAVPFEMFQNSGIVVNMISIYILYYINWCTILSISNRSIVVYHFGYEIVSVTFPLQMF